MKDYKEVERFLKRSLKKSKEFSFSIALLVTFLISGGVTSFAQDTTIDEQLDKIITRKEIDTEIQENFYNTDFLLKKNETEMQKTKLKIKQLLKRGRFWVKPLDDSYQIFFNLSLKNHSLNENMTAKNFESQELTADIQKHINEDENKEYYSIYNNKFYGSNGVLRKYVEYIDNVDFGANIKPKEVPEVEIETVELAEKTLTDPTITEPSMPEVKMQTKEQNVQAITPKTAPNITDISVDDPESIKSLDEITVAKVDPINKTITPPTLSNPTEIKAPTINKPATPGGFNPKLILPPETPQTVRINLPTITPPNLSFAGANPDPDKYFYWGGNDGVISQIILKKGNFKVNGKINEYHGNSIKVDVQNYDAELYKGCTATSETKPNNGSNTVQARFFNTICNVPYSEFGKDVDIDFNIDSSSADYQGAVLNLETEGNVSANLTNYVTDSYITNNKKNNLKSYQSYSGIQGTDNCSTELLFINKGNIKLSGDSVSYIQTTSSSNGDYRTNYIDNEGTIEATGKSTVILKHSVDTSSGKAWIYSNSQNGKMYAKGDKSVVYITANGNLPNGNSAFINEGIVELTGKESLGLYYTNNSEMKSGYLVWMKKPITIKAERAIGFIIQNTGDGVRNDKNLFQTEIKENSKNVLGILQDADGNGTKTAAVINIDTNNGEQDSNNIGLYGNKGTLKIIKPHNESGETVSSIDIKGGRGNIGLLASNSSTIEFTGESKISADATKGKNNKLALAEKGGKITLKDKVTIGTLDKRALDTIGFYATGNNSKITLEKKDGNTFNLSGDSYAAYAYDSGEIDMERTSLNSSADIDITNDDANKGKGIGLLANNKGKIKAKYNFIKIKDGKLGIGSIGDDSSVDLSHGKLSYDGDGYAIYTDGKGTVDISDATVELAGSSTAFDLDLDTSANLAVKMNSQTRIKVKSNDVVVFNLKNAHNLTTVDGIEDSIKTQAQNKLNGSSASTGSVNLQNLIESDANAKKYKIAAVDGGAITIGNIDKAGQENDTDNAKKDGYQYYNRLLAQRLKATATGVTIKAELNKDQAANFGDQVVGLEMNSSKLANSNDETQINLKDNGSTGTTLTAKRIDNAAGKGAVGVFINFGKVNIDANSKIDVENGTSNQQGVGVYSVNGSEVDNKGTITVGGKKAVGILGLAYRFKSNGSGNEIVKDEFGMKDSSSTDNKGQGKVIIKNSKDITASGDNSIGIYAENNNDITKIDENTLTNEKTGTIHVGKSEGDSTAVGIYGAKVKISNKGKIEVDKGAVGIYSLSSKVGEDNQELGTVTFKQGENIGLYLAGKAHGDKGVDTLKGTKLTIKNGTNEDGTEKGNMGIYVDLKTDENGSDLADFETKVQVETGKSKNITSYYTKSSNLTVDADVKVGEGGTGLAGAENKKLTIKDGKTLTVGKSGVGVLAKKNSAEVNGEIKLENEKAIGIYSDAQNDTTHKDVKVAGNISFNSDDTNIKIENAVGVFAQNGAEVTISENKKISFGANDSGSENIKNNIGVYLAGSTLNINSKEDIKVNKENLYSYAQASAENKGSTINLKEDVKVKANEENGVVFYLDTAVKNDTSKHGDNTFAGTTGKSLTVEEKTIGIYSKAGDNNKNIIKDLTLKVANDKTIGVYTDGNLKFESSNTIDSSNKGIGVYANKGKITLGGDVKAKLSSNGLAFFLTNGTSLEAESGKKIILGDDASSTSAASNGEKSVVAYYTKGTNNGTEVEHKAEIEFKNGISKTIALYLADGIKVKNSSKINITSGSENLGAYVSAGSTFTNSEDIKLGIANGSSSSSANGVQGADVGKSIAIYVNNGTAINDTSKKIVVKNTGTENAVAMAGIGSKPDTPSSRANEEQKTVKLENKGNIEVEGKAIGMYLADGAEGTNTGKILGSRKGVAVYVKGQNSSFKGDGGTIAAGQQSSGETNDMHGIGLVLENTAADKIKIGTLKLSGKNTVGVYSNSSVIDFEINPTNEATTDTGMISLYAKGEEGKETKIKSKVSSVSGKGAIAVYLKDKHVKFETGSSVEVKKSNDNNNYNIGIFASKDFSGNIETTINQKNGTDDDGSNTVGLFLAKKDTTASTSTSTENNDVSFKGKITAGKGIGVLVQEGRTFETKEAEIDVDSGTGIFVQKGSVKIGTTGESKATFKLNGGTAIYQEDGKLELGSHTTFSGTGDFIATKNADVDSSAKLEVAENKHGIMAEYDKSGTHSVKSSGDITLKGNKSIGIVATYKNGTAAGSGTTSTNSNFTLTNSGNIKVDENAESTVGIYSENISVENSKDKTIEVGKAGVGIYSKGGLEKVKIMNHGKIDLKKEQASGIVTADTKNLEIEVGEISSSDANADNQVGIQISKDNGAEVKIQKAKIDLKGKGAKGIVIDEVTKFSLNPVTSVVPASTGSTNDETNKTNEITIGDSEKTNRGIGLVVKKSSGQVDATNIKVGANGIGIYAEGDNTTEKIINFSKGSIKTEENKEGSVLVYAKDKAKVTLVDVTDNKLEVAKSGIGLMATDAELDGNGGSTALGTTSSNGVEVLVNKEDGIGAYVKGTNGSADASTKVGKISKNFKIKVNTNKGTGVFAEGNVSEFSTVTELRGDNSKAYVFKDLKNNAIIEEDLRIGDKVENNQNSSTQPSPQISRTPSDYATGQIGIYSFGTGNGITVKKGIEVNGNSNYGIYNKAKQDIIVEGKINVGENDKDKTSIGIYSNNTDTTNKNKITFKNSLTAGKNAVGIYAINGEVIEDNNSSSTPSTGANSKHINTSDAGVAIYVQSGKADLKTKITVGHAGGIGVSAKDSEVKVMDLTVSDSNSTQPTVAVTEKVTSIGIYSLGSGKITLGGTLDVGKEAIGIYKKVTSTTSTPTSTDANIITTENKEIKVAESGIGIYSEGAKVDNKAKISTSGKEAKGIYVKEADLESSGEIKVNQEKAIGLLVKGKTSNKLKSTGNVTVTGKDAIGIYADEAEIEASGEIKVAEETTSAVTVADPPVGTGSGTSSGNSEAKKAESTNGVGIYSTGTKSVKYNGKLTVGKNGVGIYKKGTGDMTIGNSSSSSSSGTGVNSEPQINIGENSYGIYYVGPEQNNSSRSSFTSAGNVNIGTESSSVKMKLGKEAVGVYAKGATVKYFGDIQVGETTIGANGFSDPNVNKNSIGIFAESSKVEYKGNLTVDKPLSVGIYGDGAHTDITVKSGSKIKVSNGAYGIMAGRNMKDGKITIESGAEIEVEGKATGEGAKDSNVSVGIAAYSGTIVNNGTIKISKGAKGIYLGENGKAENEETAKSKIEASDESTDNDKLSKAKTNNSANVGGVKIDNNGTVTFDGNVKVINGGGMQVDGEIKMDNLYVDINDNNKTYIDAQKFSGTALVIPSFSKGDSANTYVYKDIFRSRDKKGFGAFSGDVKSQSVSWIAKVTKGSANDIDPKGETTTKDITMARIPYPELFAGKRNENLAKGLESVRSSMPKGVSSQIFKDFDSIGSHAGLAHAAANTRGDVYANIQERMKTVEGEFNKSYAELLESYNVTRDVNKFSVIHSRGVHEDNTLGVSSFKYNTIGLLYLNDREAFRYGEKYGWSAGLLVSNYDFTGDTSKGSSERIFSGKAGIHYQRALDRKDDNAKWKWLTRAEMDLNLHKTERLSRVASGKYNYKSSYLSGELSWKNKVFYDYDMNINWELRPYLGLDLSYGKIFKIHENSTSQLALDVKGENYFVTTPKLGLQTKYTMPLKDDKQFVVKADLGYELDITQLYSKGNKAKYQGTTDYFDLSTPKRNRGRIIAAVELGYEKENNYGVSLRAEYNGNKKQLLNYSLRFNYKF